MPTVTIPLTTYSVRQANPAHKYGVPDEAPLRNNGSADARLLARVPMDKVPEDATITSALVRVWTSRAATGTFTMRAHPNTEAWKSSASWNTKPARGAVIDTDAKTNPAKNAMYELDVLTWAVTRDRLGLSIDISETTALWVRGSSADVNKPVIVVTYTVLPDAPSNLVPDGGFVSDADPILAYEADEDITQQNIQFSSDGTVPGITYDSGWLTTTKGRYDPATDPGANPTLTAGQTIYWRVRTNGASGISPWSGWAYYTFRALTTPTITNPPATTDDGSPTLQWTIAAQTSWKAEFFDDNGKLLDSTAWDEDSVSRSWTPSRSIKVPGAHGRFVLYVKDNYVPRVATDGAPVTAVVTKEFDTVLSGAGTAVNTIASSFDDAVVTITGTRSLGIPDEIALVRDGVIVPIWDSNGDAYLWAPAADFFSGNNFTIKDYTAPLRVAYTWSVRTRAAGVVSALGPTVTATYWTKSVYIVNPRTGVKVEIQGYNDKPVVEQSVSEGAIVHVPVQGDLIVEPVRRRLMRTTRSGSIEGIVRNADEDQMQNWTERDSGQKYRLIFGKVNWSVIIGDYSPSDVFYSDECSDEVVLVLLNWWERLADY